MPVASPAMTERISLPVLRANEAIQSSGTTLDCVAIAMTRHSAMTIDSFGGMG